MASTSIFARTTARGTQWLAYAMSFAAVGELAMILPLPVRRGVSEQAVRFVDFSRYPRLFEDLASGFPNTGRPRSFARGAVAAGAPTLVVHDVGDFEASFVPTVEDFDRLDERFRISRSIWDQLPTYADYGFAVFKLKGSGVESKKKVHPMVLEFPTRAPRRAYFPTLHIHDGRIHSSATFDHVLYLQRSGDGRGPPGWDRSLIQAASFVDTSRTQGLVLGDELCHKRVMRGPFANTDVWV